MARAAFSTMMVASLLVLGALLLAAPVSADAGSAVVFTPQQATVEFAHRQLLQTGMGMALIAEEKGETSRDEESGEMSTVPMKEEESREESHEESKDEESKMDSTDAALRMLIELNRKMLRA